jgi:acetyltransferase-like isoleucine patch superfamily enzyme
VLIKLIRKITIYILGKINGVRLRFAKLLIKAQDIELGENVYIGKCVNIQVHKQGQLIIENNVTILDYTNIFVHSNAFMKIGDSTFISHHCEFASSQSISIGKECAFAAYCTMIDTDKDYTDYTTPMPLRKAKTNPIILEDNIWLAYKVTVLKGVQIGRNCVVAANAVVNKNIPAYTVAAGVPAKVIKHLKNTDI